MNKLIEKMELEKVGCFAFVILGLLSLSILFLSLTSLIEQYISRCG